MRQRNIYVKLSNKEKKNFFVNLDTNVIADNINFWQIEKPLITDKTFDDDQMTLIDKYC